MKFVNILGLILAAFLISCQKQASESTVDYFGQDWVGQTPEIFAPGMISTEEEYEFGSVFSKDGKEFFYGVDVGNRAEIRYCQFINEQWTDPKVIIADQVFSFNDPFLSPDEQRLYYISDCSNDGSRDKKDYDIWYSEREGSGWSAPINAGSSINSPRNEYYISFTADGSMYFASNKASDPNRLQDFDIYKAPKSGTQFAEAIRLSDLVNHDGYEADVFVAPDESYLIFCSTRKEGLGNGDLYISFKDQAGEWTQAKNMGPPINTVHHELCPFVSPDGQFLFYTSNQDIHWVNASIIENYR